MWMKQLDTVALANISRQMQCVWVSDFVLNSLFSAMCQRLPTAGSGGLGVMLCYFSDYCFLHCHCNMIKCVSPCHKDLNLPGGFFICFSFLKCNQREKKLSDHIFHTSILLVSHLSVSLLTYSCFSCFALHKVNSHKHFAHECKRNIHSYFRILSLDSNDVLMKYVLCFFCFTLQVRSRPCDLLVWFHRRAGLPERQRYPAQRLLPYRHSHSEPCRPAGPTATRARIKTKRGGKKEKTYDGRKERGRHRGGKEQGCISRSGSNLAFLQCETAKKSALNSTWPAVSVCLSLPLFHCPKATTCKHTPSFCIIWQHRVRFIPVCKNTVLEAFLVVVSSWPLDGPSQRTARVRARAKAGH